MEHKLDPLVFDPSTGLPKLPEDLAWNVIETSYKKEVRVTISEKIVSTPPFLNRMFGDKTEVTWQFYLPFKEFFDYTDATEEDVKDIAVKIYNEIRQSQLDSSARDNLLGLYPPNSLSI